MAFGIGTNTQDADAGEVRGEQREVACECWFTSKGRIIPRMLKVQEADGEMLLINKIQVHSQEHKKYAGIPSIEFDCTLTVLDREMKVKLIYYQTESRWVLNIR